MIGIIIVSHGGFAEGLIDAAAMLYGVEQCFALKLDPADSPEDFDERLRKLLDEADTGDGVFVLADLMGGTPCNRALLLLCEQIPQGKKLRLLAGANLPMLISLMDNRQTASSFDELADVVIGETADCVLDVNKIIKKEGLIND